MRIKMKAIMLETVLATLASTTVMSGQSYTCPDNPGWIAAACSVYKAFEPSDEAIPYYLREAKPTENYRWWSLEMEGIPSIELHIWYGHYSDEREIVELVAKSVAVLPQIILRSLPENTVIALDTGSTGGAIYRSIRMNGRT